MIYQIEKMEQGLPEKELQLCLAVFCMCVEKRGGRREAGGRRWRRAVTQSRLERLESRAGPKCRCTVRTFGTGSLVRIGQTEVTNPLLPPQACWELKWDGWEGFETLRLHTCMEHRDHQGPRGHLTVAGYIVPRVNVLSPSQPLVGPLAPACRDTIPTFIKNRNHNLVWLQSHL